MHKLKQMLIDDSDELYEEVKDLILEYQYYCGELYGLCKWADENVPESNKPLQELIDAYYDAHLQRGEPAGSIFHNLFMMKVREYLENPSEELYNLIKKNIDYVIDASFHLKSMDNYVADGLILTLEKKMPKSSPKVYKAFKCICDDIMEMQDEK